MQDNLTFRSFLRFFMAAVILLVSASAASYMIFITISAPDNVSGQLVAGEVHAGEDLYHSLDLRLAAKANYDSPAFTLVKDIGTENGIKRQIISFKVPADGLTENALMYSPATDTPEGGFPALIICHGYINPEDYSTTQGYLADMEFYAKKGFAVIKPDFRGQGLSMGQGVAESVYFSMAYNIDLMSLISSVKHTKTVDKDDINLWGHSMGAYIALRTSVISPDIKRTVLLSGPIGSLQRMYLAYIPPSDINNPDALKSRHDIFVKYGTPAESSDFWRSASPSNFLKRTSVRYQIHAGKLDSIVPPSLSAEFNDQLNSQNRTHEYYLYENGTHSLATSRPLIWSRSLTFLTGK